MGGRRGEVKGGDGVKGRGMNGLCVMGGMTGAGEVPGCDLARRGKHKNTALTPRRD